MRRRRQDRPKPEAPSTGDDEPGNDELEAALRDMAHRFLALTDQAENDLGGSGGSAGPDPDVPDPDVAPATDAPAAGTATAAPGGAKPAGPTGGSRRRRRRRTLRRVVPAALVVAAVAVPGSGVLGSVTALMRGDSRNVGSELALGEGGFLPVQDEAPSIEQFQDPAQLEAVPVSEAPVSAPVQAILSSARVVEELGTGGIPEVALRAYHRAADRLGTDDPACGVRWSLLAAIGRVESNHGRFGGAQLREDGYGTQAIRGIPLDGRPHVALIRDTDGGELDGDTTFDRAVGPMQFIPSTWRSVGVDANDDGRRDPNNMFDATRGAAGYLCTGGGDLGTIDGQARAVRRYNNADDYVQVVLRLARMYDTGRVTPLPSLPALPGPPPLPQPTPSPGPTRPAPTRAPGTPGTIPGRSTTTAPPTTVAPTTTTTTAPSPTTTTPPTTPAPAPDPDGPTATTTPSTPTTPVPVPVPEPEEPPAAVGWAPAMREVVIGIIDDDEPSPTTTVPATVCDPRVADPTSDADGNVLEPPAGCTDVPAAPADDPAAPPAGTGETPPPSDPATPPTT